MYIIVDATHSDFRQVVADMQRVYNARREKSIFKPQFNFRETEAFMRIKDRRGEDDIPLVLRARISNILIRRVDKTFFHKETLKDASEWWPVDMDEFESLRGQGVYKGERVEEIFRNREEIRADNEDLSRDRMGLPPLPRFRDEGEGEGSTTR